MKVSPIKHSLLVLALALPAPVIFYACNQAGAATGPQMNGTWQLISGMTITKKDTAWYPKDFKMIKIINNTHFAFLRHDLNPPKDSSNHFDAGGGSYTLNGDQYTEHLDYYTDRNWEGKPFNFTVQINGDTLTQTGIEKVDAAGINRTIVEKYVRVGTTGK
jgi:hypothetical protein